MSHVKWGSRSVAVCTEVKTLSSSTTRASASGGSADAKAVLILDASDNREKGCRDIQRLVPIGKVDKQKFGAAIDGLTPKGYTPMGNALRKARHQHSLPG